MPMYSTRCSQCNRDSSRKLSFVDYDLVQAGQKSLECPSCHGRESLAFDPGNVKFVMKDGESGGWASKAQKENRYRGKRRVVMGQKQRDHVPGTKLMPNFGGAEVESWREAKAMAFDKAVKETQNVAAARAVASTYDKHVVGEKT